MITETRVLLDPQERRVLFALREIPESPLKTRLDSFLADLVRMIGDPGCAEVQADGLPCGATSADCEKCLQLSAMLKRLQATLERHQVRPVSESNRTTPAGVRRV